jgi:Pyruvate/2-oxoacid:ferredoxin oxidoreductase gamma subunit
MAKKNQNVGEEFIHSFKVNGEDLLKEVKKLIHEGNVRKIVLKDEKGEKTFLEIPLTVGVIGTVLLPILAAVGALAAMVGLVTVELIKEESSKSQKSTVRKSPVGGKKAAGKNQKNL